MSTIAIERALGSAFETATEEIHVFDGRAGDNPLAVWLRFAESRWLHLRCAPDGESLSIDDQEPTAEGYSMGQNGRVEVRNSHETRFQSWFGHRLEAAWTTAFETSSAVAGVRLQLGDREPLIIFNWGDDLYVRSRYPPKSRPIETAVPRPGSS